MESSLVRLPAILQEVNVWSRSKAEGCEDAQVQKDSYVTSSRGWHVSAGDIKTCDSQKYRDNIQVIWDSWGVSDKGAKTFRQKNPYSNHYSDQHQEYEESDELEDD